MAQRALSRPSRTPTTTPQKRRAHLSETAPRRARSRTSGLGRFRWPTLCRGPVSLALDYLGAMQSFATSATETCDVRQVTPDDFVDLELLPETARRASTVRRRRGRRIVAAAAVLAAGFVALACIGSPSRAPFDSRVRSTPHPLAAPASPRIEVAKPTDARRAEKHPAPRPKTRHRSRPRPHPRGKTQPARVSPPAPSRPPAPAATPRPAPRSVEPVRRSPGGFSAEFF
jgi:hypothetical protein